MTQLRSALLGELVATDPAVQFVGVQRTSVTGIAYEVHAVQPGDLFVALPGADPRWRQLAAEAVARGAAALLVESPLGLGVPELVTPDSQVALARVAAAFYGHPSREVGVIGVTGTHGKTTTIYLLDAILRAAGLKTGFVSTVAVRVGRELQPNLTHLTTPPSPEVQRSLRRMVEAGANWAILEATSQGLVTNRLDEVRFRVGAVTSITAEHLDYRRCDSNYWHARGILLERVAAAGGVAVLNVDDLGAAERLTYVGASRIIRYSALGRAADIRAVDIELNDDCARFILEAAGQGRLAVGLPLIGPFSVASALCAAGVALGVGLPLETIQQGLEAAPAVPGRMVRVDEGQLFAVIVDFARTPAVLTQVLHYLRSQHRYGRIIVVIGGAAYRDRKRHQIGSVAASLADLSVFTTDDPLFEDPQGILTAFAAGAQAVGGQRNETFVCIADRQEAIRYTLEAARPNDCVLLAGKGHEASTTSGDDERPWDDANIARHVLNELGYGVGTPGQRSRTATSATAPLSSVSSERTVDAVPVGELTIGGIFHQRSPLSFDQLDASRLRTILATGDIIPARGVDVQVRRHGAKHVFAHVSEVLRQGDLTIANLEAPLLGGCPPATRNLIFCGAPAMAAAMATAGIDVVSLANNHIEDFGSVGVDETIVHLEAAGLDYATSDRMAVRDVKGLKVGLIAFSGVGRGFDRPLMARQLNQCRPQVDLLLVSCHWGKEYCSIPEPSPDSAPDDPREIARLAVDHGADLILGNHPHWVQGIEIVRGGFVAYAHGNFVFDQFWSQETREGVIGRYTFYDASLINVAYTPIFIEETTQPRLMSEEESASVIRRMEGSSIILHRENNSKANIGS